MWWDLGPCGEGEYPSSSPTAKTFTYQEDADGTWLQFGPLLYSQLSWLCFSSHSSRRTSLLMGHHCFLSPSASGWKVGKLLSVVTRDTPGLQGSCVTSGTLGILTPCSVLHLIPIFAALLFSQANY